MRILDLSLALGNAVVEEKYHFNHQWNIGPPNELPPNSIIVLLTGGWGENDDGSCIFSEYGITTDGGGGIVGYEQASGDGINFDGDKQKFDGNMHTCSPDGDSFLSHVVRWIVLASIKDIPSDIPTTNTQESTKQLSPQNIMKELTTFTGIATVTEFDGKPILISAGDIDTLKAYLGQQEQPGDPEVCNVSITVGPRAEITLPSMAGLIAAQKFASKLGIRQIGRELTREESEEAKSLGLVVVFGSSDDLAEFRGAIYDESGLGDIYFTAKGKFFDEDRIEELEGMLRDGEIASLPPINRINAFYGEIGHQYFTEIPHARFTVMEDGEQFSEGIVFHISDLNQ